MWDSAAGVASLPAPQMVSVPLPIRDGAAFLAALYRVTGSKSRLYLENGRYLRLSVQCYNNQSELDGLVAAVAELLRKVCA